MTCIRIWNNNFIMLNFANISQINSKPFGEELGNSLKFALICKLTDEFMFN